MPETSHITLPAMTGRQRASWHALIELAPTLGGHWLLVGGQMVFLHEIERHASEVRPTDDVDVAVDLRAEPTGLATIHKTLLQAGFSQDTPAPDGIAHRYRRNAAAIDVLAPDNIGDRAQLGIGTGRTIEAPGTSQAFRRNDTVTVELQGHTARIRRPNLIGALLGKIAAATKITSQSTAERTKHRQDADALAQLLGATDRRHLELTHADRRLLREFMTNTTISPLALAQIGLLLPTDPD